MSDHETMNVLRKRIDNAEDNTKELVSQLTKMGFPPVQPNRTGAISPFKVQSVDPEVLRKNYENLVSRVCKSESALQTLRLALTRVETDRDLKRKEKMAATDKVNHVASAFEGEMKRLNNEIEMLKKERSAAWEMKLTEEEKCKHLQQNLAAESDSKTKIALEAEDMQAQNNKLVRRVSELREQVARETSLRASLEESHNSLLSRVQEMEGIVESERDEVKSLNTTCLSLKREAVKAQEERESERALRLQLEQQIHLTTEREQRCSAALASLEAEKQHLLDQVNTVNEQYKKLHQQLDHMTELFDQKQDQERQLALQSEAGKRSIELQQKLKGQEQKQSLTEQKCTQLSLQIKELEAQRSTLENQVTSLRAQLQTDADHWKKQLRLAEEEKERLLKDKDALLEEVNTAVDSMSEEKQRLEGELDEARIEQRALENGRVALEMENRRLLDRVNSMDQHMSSQQQVQSTLQDMVEQKNKLAYEKGKLHTQVTSLQRDVETLANASNELTQSKKLNITLEAKLSKVETELQDSRLTVQRLEAEQQQREQSTQRSQRDFELAIKARDEAVRESQRLHTVVEGLEERTKKSSSGLQQNLEDARSDNRKLSATLESVMASHTRMQQTLEHLQLEMGKKDAAALELNQEKLTLQSQLLRYEKETEMLHSKVAAQETYESTELEPLRKQLQKLKTDNTKMATSMEAMVRANQQLQGTAEALQDQLQQKAHVMQQLQQARDEDQESHKHASRVFEERLENFKAQLAREREKSTKKASKDVEEVRRQLEDILSKNGELSRANADLRHKVTELEFQIKDHKDKLSAQKRHIEHLTKIRQKQDKAIDSLEGITEQIKELEKAKNYYIKKNKEQAKTVQSFISQIAELQAEIRSLAQAQIETTAILEEQEMQLAKERQTTEAWKHKYKANIKGGLRDSRGRERRLEELQRKAETGLAAVKDESLVMSANMQNANTWFTSQLDTLQRQSAKKDCADPDTENARLKVMLEEEQGHAEDVARRARVMIQASRETVSRLADYATESNKDATDQLYTLKAQLDAERENSLSSELKLREFQESSLRHTEELARELEYLKAQQAMAYSS